MKDLQDNVIIKYLLLLLTLSLQDILEGLPDSARESICKLHEFKSKLKSTDMIYEKVSWTILRMKKKRTLNMNNNFFLLMSI